MRFTRREGKRLDQEEGMNEEKRARETIGRLSRTGGTVHLSGRTKKGLTLSRKSRPEVPLSPLGLRKSMKIIERKDQEGSAAT